jgi:spore germination protein KA
MKIYYDHTKKITTRESSVKDKNLVEPPSKEQDKSIFTSLDENFEFLNSHFGNGIDLVEAKYDILKGTVQAGIVFIDSISDKILIGNQIIKPLLEALIDSENELDKILVLLQTKLIYIPGVKKSNSMEDIIESLLNGNTILFLNGINEVLIIPSQKIEKRSIEKPNNEVTTLASMDSFTEDLVTNCSMVIRRLPTTELRFETFSAGSLSRTEIKLIYIQGICKLETINEVKSRIQKIDIDIVDGIGTLAELIEDKPLSIFPKYKQTQRSDVIAKNLSDGRFALLCSNSPFGLVAPISFFDNFKTMDDYADKSLNASYLRCIRAISFLLSILISPLYLAFVTYNHAIVPPALALNIASGREGVPFPSFIELLVMTLFIGVIREASFRLPGTVGYFVGALAAVVIGQATVLAGYVSASVIIVVAISTVSSFAISSTTLLYPSRFLNYFMIFLAGIFGMFGVINGIAIILWHMISLESFGMPYLYPLVPFDMAALKDTIIRLPYSTLNKRFRMLVAKNDTRLSNKGMKHEKKKGG